MKAIVRACLKEKIINSGRFITVKRLLKIPHEKILKNAAFIELNARLSKWVKSARWHYDNQVAW